MKVPDEEGRIIAQSRFYVNHEILSAEFFPRHNMMQTILVLLRARLDRE